MLQATAILSSKAVQRLFQAVTRPLSRTDVVARHTQVHPVVSAPGQELGQQQNTVLLLGVAFPLPAIHCVLLFLPFGCLFTGFGAGSDGEGKGYLPKGIARGKQGVSQHVY